MEIQKEKLKDAGKEAARKAQIFLKGKLNLLLPLIFLILIGYSVYIWYVFAFNPNWTEAERNEYIRNNQKNSSFERKRFDSVIASIKERRENYQKSLGSIPDIFRFK